MVVEPNGHYFELKIINIIIECKYSVLFIYIKQTNILYCRLKNMADNGRRRRQRVADSDDEDEDTRLRKCQAPSRRHKYTTLCNSYAMRGHNYCYFHTKYEPFKEANRNRVGDNTKISSRLDAKNYDALFLTFCLRIIKDSVRKIQIPIDVDLSVVRVDVDRLYIVYLVIDEPRERAENVVVQVKWPMKIILTNIYKFNGLRNENEYSFDVFMPQYSTSEYVWARNVFRQVFIRELKGHQIFNCKYGHYAPFRLNVSISPFLFDSNNIPVDLLCLYYIKLLSKEAYHVRRLYNETRIEQRRQWASKLTSANGLNVSEMIQRNVNREIESVLRKRIKETMIECSRVRPYNTTIDRIKALAQDIQITSPILIDTRAAFVLESVPPQHLAGQRSITELLEELERTGGIEWFLNYMVGREDYDNQYPVPEASDLGLGVTAAVLDAMPVGNDPPPLNYLNMDAVRLLLDRDTLNAIDNYARNDDDADRNANMVDDNNNGGVDDNNNGGVYDNNGVVDDTDVLRVINEVFGDRLIEDELGDNFDTDLANTDLTDDRWLGEGGEEHMVDENYWIRFHRAYGSCLYTLEDYSE